MKRKRIIALALVGIFSIFVSTPVFAAEKADYYTETKGIRILPGQWRPHYAFEQIVWVSPPWPCQDYIWLDFPEAIFTDAGLHYLSHINPQYPALFPGLPKVPWQRIPDGLTFERQLPDGVKFGGSITKNSDSTGVKLELYIHNQSDKPLRNFRLQTCAYLRAIKEFADYTSENKFVHLPESGWQPFDKARKLLSEKGRFRLGWRGGPALADWPVIVTVSKKTDRLVAFTWYEDTYSLIQNPVHPCMHADPFFPNLEVGQKVVVHGELLFFEGTIEQFTPWFKKRWESKSENPG